MYEISTYIDPNTGMKMYNPMIDKERGLSFRSTGGAGPTPGHYFSLTTSERDIELFAIPAGGASIGRDNNTTIWTIEYFRIKKTKPGKQEFKDAAEKQYILELLVDAFFDFGSGHDGRKTRARGAVYIVKYKDQIFSSEDVPL